MRDIATTNANNSPAKPPRPLRIARWRPWVQLASLLVWFGPFVVGSVRFAFSSFDGRFAEWMLPLKMRLHSIPSCMFHCYACPLRSFACPIGLMASFFALHAFPWLVVGVVLVVAAFFGTLICGWACPFGFLQDLVAKIPTKKIRLPDWTGYGRFVVLVALVIVAPYFLGKVHNPIFICKLCPAGALEAGVPAMVSGTIETGELDWSMNWIKTTSLALFVGAMLFIYRPWCRLLCPLGAIFSLFNRVSLFHLRFDRDNCTACNLCRSRCEMGVEVEKNVNTLNCNRCMECTTCGAIRPALGTWRRHEK